MPCTLNNSSMIKTKDLPLMVAQQRLIASNRWREVFKPDGILLTDVDVLDLQVGEEICIFDKSCSSKCITT
jgi:hypothetical protein